MKFSSHAIAVEHKGSRHWHKNSFLKLSEFTLHKELLQFSQTSEVIEQLTWQLSPIACRSIVQEGEVRTGLLRSVHDKQNITVTATPALHVEEKWDKQKRPNTRTYAEFLRRGISQDISWRDCQDWDCPRRWTVTVFLTLQSRCKTPSLQKYQQKYEIDPELVCCIGMLAPKGIVDCVIASVTVWTKELSLQSGRLRWDFVLTLNFKRPTGEKLFARTGTWLRTLPWHFTLASSEGWTFLNIPW